jgi:hypothetical protein
MRKPWLLLLASGLLLLSSCRAVDPPKTETHPEQKGDAKAMQPVSSGYVEVNGIKLYHEVYGAGEPLVLLQPSNRLLSSCQLVTPTFIGASKPLSQFG